MTKHFLDLKDVQTSDLRTIIEGAKALKAARRAGSEERPLAGKSLAMIFEKPSTRTRVSFECAIRQLGGDAVVLNAGDMQIGRGESIHDTAKVLSRYVDGIMIRCFSHDLLTWLAEHATVPVINGLTNEYHPCQVLADLFTWVEQRGPISGRTVAWIGDGNNMCNSYINAARQFDFELKVACPEGYEPRADLLTANKDRVSVVRDSKDAAKDSDLLVTDVFASMGQENEQAKRLADFAGYQINHELLAVANSDALVMHCLPAHRGEEISAEVMADPESVIWQEAENRLHAQKALMEFLLAES